MNTVAGRLARAIARACGPIIGAGLMFGLTGCHAIKTQLGMNAGASSTSTTGSAGAASTSSASTSTGSAGTTGKKPHLGGGDKGTPGLLETLGRGGHDEHDASGFDGAQHDVSPPRFVWRSHSGAAQDRAGKHRF